MTMFAMGWAGFAMGWVGAVALAASACAGSTRSAGTSSGATAAPATAPAPSGAASAMVGDTSSAGAPTRVVVGRVELLDRANDVTLSGTEGVGLGFDKFKIQPDTPVLLNDQQVGVAEINPGDEVRATFTGKDDDAHLQRIEILPSTR